MHILKLPETVEALLGRLVAIPSVNAAVTGDRRAEAAMGDYLLEAAAAMGLEARRLPVEGRADNILIQHLARPGLPWLLFISHMDTVAVEGMTISPFGGDVRDGRVWGRGACDTKGTGAAMLWAMWEYARANGATGRGGGMDAAFNVALAFTVDEENGMSGVRGLLKQRGAWGFDPAGVIVGEPTDLRIVAAHNGFIRWQLETRGVSAHSSDPSRGRSAISAMARAILAIEARYIPGISASHHLIGKGQGSINLINGGSQANIIPERCLAVIDRRLSPSEGIEEEHRKLTAFWQAMEEVSPEQKGELRNIGCAPPLRDESNVELCRLAGRALRGLGLNDEPTGAPYATEAGDLCEAGLGAIVLGPGTIRQAHTKEESIAVQELQQGVEVYLGLMRNGAARIA